MCACVCARDNDNNFPGRYLWSRRRPDLSVAPTEAVYYNYYYYYLCKGISRVPVADEVEKLLKFSELDGQKYWRPPARSTIIYCNNNNKKKKPPVTVYVRRASEQKRTRKDAVKFIRTI